VPDTDYQDFPSMRRTTVLLRSGAVLAIVISAVALQAGSIQAAPGSAVAPAAANANSTSLGDPQSALQTGDAAKARQILAALLIRDPGNAPALRMLGSAQLKLKDFEGALASLTASLTIEPNAPQTMFALALVHAARQETDPAFDWLGKTKATRKFDMSQIEADPRLVALKSDPRFATLLPTSADFADPFVEPVKLIREWDGEAANDQFGWIARSVGDIDGDRIQDFVTSAPTKDIGGASAGRVYVYSTGTGKLLWSVEGKPGDELGTGVEGAGDCDGDGVPDVVASAPGSDQAYIYSGKDGHVLQHFNGPVKGDQFGRHVSGVGDFDGDSHADVIVGAPGPEQDSKTPGHAYVYSGKDGHLLLTLSGERPGDGFGSVAAGYAKEKQRFIVVGAGSAGSRHTGRVYVYDRLSKTPKFTIESDETGGALGYMFVAVTEDTDGDGVPDIFASDWSNAAKGRGTGRVYLHSGRTGKRLLTLTGETAGEGFGTTHSTAGDVDHDGYDDLIVGSWQYAGAAISGGRAYLYSGKAGQLLKTYTSRIAGDTFGFDAVGLGDIDGDGSVDLLITSGWSAVHGFHSGRVLLISSGVGGSSAPGSNVKP
jgi:hypothetical protein